MLYNGASRSHLNKSFPSGKMFPKHVLWMLHGEQPVAEQSAGVRKVLKHIHTRKSRQYLKRLDKLEQCQSG